MLNTIKAHAIIINNAIAAHEKQVQQLIEQLQQAQKRIVELEVELENKETSGEDLSN